jgi:hypothetical protein
MICRYDHNCKCPYTSSLANNEDVICGECQHYNSKVKINCVPLHKRIFIIILIIASALALLNVIWG